MYKFPIVFFVFLFLVCVSLSHAAENPYALDTKVYKNEEAISNLQKQQADLYLRIDNLLVKYGEMKGRLEDIANKINHLQSSINGISGSNAKSVNPQQGAQVGIDYNQNAQSAKAKTYRRNHPQQTISPKMPQGPSHERVVSDEKAYASAKKIFDNGNYSEAIKSFVSFKNKYSKSKYVPNAIFYIAQSYYKKNIFDKAIINYDYLINTYPKSNKATDATLKEGISFIKIGDATDGKYLLSKVVEQYPKSSQAQIAKKYLKNLK